MTGFGQIHIYKEWV